MGNDVQELDPAAAVAFLKKRSAGSGEMDPAAAVEFLRGIAPPKPPGFLQAAGGSFLEGLSTIPGALSLAGDQMATPGVQNVLGGRNAAEEAQHQDQYSLAPGAPQEAMQAPAPMQGAEALLRGGAQAVYPEEQRGLGGFTETIGSGLGSIGAGALGAAAGGPTQALVFGAQAGVPAYYKVLEATGDKAKATAALLFGGAVGQLQGFGAAKSAGSIIEKLATGKAGEAVRKIAMKAVLGGATNAGVQAAQVALGDWAEEHLTGKDLDNWQHIKDSVPPALLLGGVFGGIDEAIGRRAQERAKVEPTAKKETAKAETAPAVEIPPLAVKAPGAEPKIVLPEEVPPPQVETTPTMSSSSSEGEAKQDTTAQPTARLEEMHAGPPNPLGKTVTTSKAKKWIRRALGLDTPKAATRQLEIASGSKAAEMTEAGRSIVELDKAARAAHGRKWRALPVAEDIDAAFEGDRPSFDKLDPKIQEAVTGARAHLDRLIRSQVKEGGVVDPKEYPEFAKKILDSQGTYSTRAFKAFNDPEWADKITPDVRQRTADLFRSWDEYKNATDGEIQAELDTILTRAKESAENPWKEIAAGKLGRKDLSIYKRRKDIPVELREFLGEIKDPITNYANSVAKIAGVVARHEAFTNIRKIGLGSWLHEKPTGAHTAKLSSENQPGLRPLDGLYTTPEIKTALKETTPEDSHMLVKGLMKVNAAVKWGKVLGQPWGIMRNLEGNISLIVANGHLPKFWKPKEWAAALGKGGVEQVKKYQRLGVISQGISMAEMSDLRASMKLTPEELAKGHARSPLGVVTGTVERAFEAADNAPKIRFFEAEKAALEKAGFKTEQAEEMSADRTRDLMPTTERMAPILKKFRRQPFLGTFFAFRAEVLRTTFNRLKLIKEELGSANPEVRKMGARRAVGQIVASAATPTLAYTVNMLNGVDSEEDKERREFVPPWDKNSQMVWFGTEKKGDYLDLSDVDPLTMFSDPLVRVMNGSDPKEAISTWAKEEAGAFAGPSITSRLLIDMATGKDENDRPIDDMPEHIWKSVRPGIAASAERAGKTGIAPELGSAATGLRRYDFDVEKSLGFAINDFARGISGATEKRNRRERKEPGSKAPAAEQEATRRESFASLSRKARAAIRLGVSYGKVLSMLDKELSSESARAVLANAYVPYQKKQK